MACRHGPTSARTAESSAASSKTSSADPAALAATASSREACASAAPSSRLWTDPSSFLADRASAESSAPTLQALLTSVRSAASSAWICRSFGSSRADGSAVAWLVSTSSCALTLPSMPRSSICCWQISDMVCSWESSSALSSAMAEPRSALSASRAELREASSASRAAFQATFSSEHSETRSARSASSAAFRSEHSVSRAAPRMSSLPVSEVISWLKTSTTFCTAASMAVATSFLRCSSASSLRARSWASVTSFCPSVSIGTAGGPTCCASVSEVSSDPTVVSIGTAANPWEAGLRGTKGR
mmetsp:Transcript_12778/g.37989  ORF Transcript_12778/g.37989 Transcript_12778/m.37989 type:complete len:301 (+) Transcript_12778:801-1703(+)